MKIDVESPEELGSLAFKMLIKDALVDLHLVRLIDEVRVCVKLDPFLFYISVKQNPYPPTIKIDDVLNITEAEGDILKIEIVEEMYAPHLLRLLWDKFGDEKVNQIRRNILEVEASEDEIMELPIHQLKEREVGAMIQDFIHRTIPIGLRVVRKIDELTYIASEDPITEEHVKMMREMASHPPKELSIGDDELIPEASEEVREDVRQLYI